MSTYEQLKGLKVKYLSADTSGDRLVEGELFYNSTDFKLKSHISAGVWHSATNYPSVLFRAAALGTTTASIIVSGSSTSTNRLTTSHEYNGTGFSAGGTINSARRLLSGSGTQTAGLVFGGATAPADNAVSNTTETYDGSSFAEVNNLNTARQGSAGDGSQTATFMAGGTTAPGHTAASEDWDGTSWTNLPSINSSRRFLSGNGTPSAAVVFGGETTPTGTPAALRKLTEEYNGSSWSEVNDLNTGTATNGSGGIQTALISFAGRSPSISASAEFYDGTSWTATGSLATARSMVSGTGTKTSAITAGGEGPGDSLISNVEEFDLSLATTTGGVWSSGGNINAGRESLFGGGLSQNASWVAGGEAPGSTVNSSEEYNGTAWAEGNNLNTARRGGGTCGSQTAALYSAGLTGPSGTPVTANSEEYNGTSWSEGDNLNTARGANANAGVQTSALTVGGSADGASTTLNNSESYNGTAYSNETVFPSDGYNMTGTGTAETASLFAGGEAPYPGTNPTVRTWNGSAWTVVSQDLSSIVQQTTRGKQFFNSSPYENADIIGGQSSSTFHGNWNGTVWSTRASMSAGRQAAGSGTAASGLATSGAKPSTATEEWDGEVTANVAKTVDFD